METNKKFWQEKIKIKNLLVPRFMSAPIDGVTDSPMRELIRDYSPDILLFGEMRHVALIANKKGVDNSLQYKECEHPLAFQISTNCTNFVELAVEKILAKKFDSINLNVGCPARRIVKSGAGSALMANLPELEKIIQLLVKTIDKRVSLTIKIRAGFKEKNALEVALMAQEAGVDALIIHPRTQPEGFAARLDFDLVKKIKESIKMPVIFSGNINSFKRAEQTYERTGVDGFMIGRALYGSPWKIREIMDESQGKKFEVTTKQSLQIALRHLELTSQFYGAHRAYNMIKRHISQYIKTIPNASKMRVDLLRCQSPQDMQDNLKKLLSENE